jgi:glucokinase
MPPPTSTKPFVGIDLGGTNMQIGIVGPDQRLLGQAKKKTKAEEGFEKVVDRIADGIMEACTAAALTPAQLGGIGIGAPGVIDAGTGVVVEAVNLRWTNAPLAEALSKRMKLRVTADNDVNVAVVGEHRHPKGAGQNVQNLLGIWVGTGIGGGLILNGKLHYGHFHSAGEIGHTVVYPHMPLGSRTLENNASRTNVSNRIIKLINSNYKSRLTTELGADPNAWTGEVKSKLIAKHYRGGEREDALVVRVVDDAAAVIATAIANAVTLLSLERVILGGGLTEACGKPFVELVSQSAKEMIFPRLAQKVEIVASKLEDAAGIYGAAFLAMERK